MELTIVGCSGSFAGPESPASSYLVQAEHEGRTWSVVLDLGSGALGTLQRHVDPYAVDAVLLSHLHVDHFIDLCGLYVMMKYVPGGPGRGPMPVWGPSGTGAHLARAYGNPDVEDILGVYDVNHLCDRKPLTIGPFVVTPVRVAHPVESYGFRVEAGGRTLVYTGDTDSCEQLSELMTGADLVLADSAFVEGRDTVEGIHLSGRRAAEAAIRAGGVRRLMLTHLPAWNDPEVCRAQAAEVWPGKVELAEPGVTYSL
ncbi:metal-dependent hydrolase [Intrasporangium oryzae NRRL B-24470]|uniref:Metal-dependent hydrolase n=1 Tax=Intrasporangium oryzae NRRL B-24470 TaxID=1386089 RepID=W9G4A9_9MICO|nr:MBL fold metallo-hydrolase [Intrasporangium oryzae]EWT00976.1 metal-dependent hydrolase [Intrasporangium oryzae NRRL B-24470]